MISSLLLLLLPQAVHVQPDWDAVHPDAPEACVLDSSGGAYTFAGTQVRRLDAAGNLAWTVSPANVDDPDRLAVLSDDSVVVGYTAKVPPFSNAWDAVVARYDTSGSPLWSRSIDFGTRDYVVDVVVDAADVAYVVTGDEEFDIGGWGDIYLTAFDAAGNQLWQTVWTGQGTGYGYRDAAYDLAYDASLQRLYVVGSSRPSSNSKSDHAVLAFDTSGNLLWTWTHDGPAFNSKDWLTHVGVVPGAGLVATGRSPSPSNNGFDVYTVRLDQNGGVVWDATWASSGSDETPTAFTSAPSGECFVATGGRRLLHYDASGTLLGAFRARPPGYSAILFRGLGLDPHGHLVAWGQSAKGGNRDCFLLVGDLSAPSLIGWDIRAVTPSSNETLSEYYEQPFAVDGAGHALGCYASDASGVGGGAARYTVP